MKKKMHEMRNNLKLALECKWMKISTTKSENIWSVQRSDQNRGEHIKLNGVKVKRVDVFK